MKDLSIISIAGECTPFNNVYKIVNKNVEYQGAKIDPWAIPLVTGHQVEN
jgi:hypothetical protein